MLSFLVTCKSETDLVDNYYAELCLSCVTGVRHTIESPIIKIDLANELLRTKHKLYLKNNNLNRFKESFQLDICQLEFIEDEPNCVNFKISKNYYSINAGANSSVLIRDLSSDVLVKKSYDYLFQVIGQFQYKSVFDSYIQIYTNFRNEYIKSYASSYVYIMTDKDISSSDELTFDSFIESILYVGKSCTESSSVRLGNYRRDCTQLIENQSIGCEAHGRPILLKIVNNLLDNKPSYYSVVETKLPLDMCDNVESILIRLKMKLENVYQPKLTTFKQKTYYEILDYAISILVNFFKNRKSRNFEIILGLESINNLNAITNRPSASNEPVREPSCPICGCNDNLGFHYGIECCIACSMFFSKTSYFLNENING